MKIQQLIIIVILLLASNVTEAGNKHSKSSLFPSYNGHVIAGYQGWFRAPKDGTMYPYEKQVRIDMWPDLTEYEKTYPTGLKLADGSTARFFSSTDKSTVDLHFKWMKNDPEYGGCAVMLGVPTFWRDLNSDCNPDPYLHELIKQADIVLPWMVQRFSPLLHNDMDRYHDLILNDIKMLRKEKPKVGLISCNLDDSVLYVSSLTGINLKKCLISYLC